MNRHLENDRERLCRNIRREMGGEMTSRFCRSLSAFQPADALPAPFGDLLARLEEAEDGRLRRC